MSYDLNTLLATVKQRDPQQTVFHQAVEEVFTSLDPFLKKNPKYTQHGLLERIVEPERVIMFRVPWVNDKGEVKVNRVIAFKCRLRLVLTKAACVFTPLWIWAC